MDDETSDPTLPPEDDKTTPKPEKTSETEWSLHKRPSWYDKKVFDKAKPKKPKIHPSSRDEWHEMYTHPVTLDGYKEKKLPEKPLTEARKEVYESVIDDLVQIIARLIKNLKDKK